MNRFKNVTHVIAAGLVTFVGGALTFAYSPAGQTVIAQYPKLTAFVTVLAMIGTMLGVYHDPKVPN